MIVTDWVNLKMKKENNFETQINNAKNVIVNNGNEIKSQENLTQKLPKDKLGKYSLWITIIGIMISIIIGWKEIIAFLN